MPMKFEYTLKDKIKDAAKDINDSVLTAYDTKREEIEQTIIPKSIMDSVTPEQTRRAEIIGLVIGAGILFVGVCIAVGWLYYS